MSKTKHFNPENNPRSAAIVKAVCDEFEMPVWYLMENNKSRLPKFVNPRNYIAYIAHRIYGYTQTSIGNYFGKTHATIINSITNVSNDIEFYKEHRETLERITSYLKKCKEVIDGELFELSYKELPMDFLVDLTGFNENEIVKAYQNWYIKK